MAQDEDRHKDNQEDPILQDGMKDSKDYSEAADLHPKGAETDQSGIYRLTVNGLSGSLKLCNPVISGTNVTLSGVGGEPGTDFTVLTSPLVEAPLATWTPLFTNQFDFFGVFTRSNAYPRTEPRRFFIIQQH